MKFVSNADYRTPVESGTIFCATVNGITVIALLNAPDTVDAEYSVPNWEGRM